MGLNDVSPFDPEKKIIGFPEVDQVEEGALRGMSLMDFAAELSRESPAPGGGSIAALAGALGASLGAMVVNLTLPKQEYEAVSQELHGYGRRAQVIKDELLLAVDRDTDAFNAVLEAMRLPKGTDEQMRARDEAVQAGYKEAVMVPFRTAEGCLEALKLCRDIAKKGNEASVTDAGVGALMSYSGLVGAVYNVRINFKEITDEVFIKDIDGKCAGLEEMAGRYAQETWSTVQSKL
jgi:glutamate formiminotransferase/formiminotetrahydrofolate cyclodeaminase